MTRRKTNDDNSPKTPYDGENMNYSYDDEGNNDGYDPENPYDGEIFMLIQIMREIMMRLPPNHIQMT